MTKHYAELAQYYDAIYAEKDYEGEVEKLHTLIEGKRVSDGNTLLEVACGTGEHCRFFSKYYDVIGLDYSREMLRIAREKHPEIEFIHGDMKSLKLNKQFDVITCLFGSISYLLTIEELGAAIGGFAQHLKIGVKELLVIYDKNKNT